MRLPLIAATAACCFLANILTGSGQGLELGAQYWQMKPSGTGSVGSDGEKGTKFDIDDDFGYEEENLLGFEASFGGGSELMFSYLSVDLSGRNELSEPIRFSDTTYPAGTDVSSSMKADLVRLAYCYQGGSYGFRGGFLVGAEFMEYEAELSAADLGHTRESASALLPIVGVKLRFDPSSLFRLDLSVVGSPWDWEDTRVDFWDGEANLRINLSSFFVGIGYRYISLDVSEDNVPLEADLKFRGPQLIGGLTF